MTRARPPMRTRRCRAGRWRGTPDAAGTVGRAAVDDPAALHALPGPLPHRRRRSAGRMRPAPCFSHLSHYSPRPRLPPQLLPRCRQPAPGPLFDTPRPAAKTHPPPPPLGLQQVRLDPISARPPGEGIWSVQIQKSNAKGAARQIRPAPSIYGSCSKATSCKLDTPVSSVAY